MGSLRLGQESIRVDQKSILANQHEHHRVVLANQDDMLRAFCASVEVTMRRAAREQREGRSMAFDAMRAMEAPTPTVPFPQAEVVPRSRGVRANSSNCRPREVRDEESRSGASDVCVRPDLSRPASRPDLIIAGSRERWS